MDNEELLRLQRDATNSLFKDKINRVKTRKKRVHIGEQCPIRIVDAYMIFEAIAKMHDVPKASREAIADELARLFHVLDPTKFSESGLQAIYRGFVNEPRRWTVGKLVEQNITLINRQKDPGIVSDTCPRCLRSKKNHSPILCAVKLIDDKWYWDK